VNLARSRVLKSPIAIESLPPAQQHAQVANSRYSTNFDEKDEWRRYQDQVELGLGGGAVEALSLLVLHKVMTSLTRGNRSSCSELNGCCTELVSNFHLGTSGLCLFTKVHFKSD